MARVGKMRISNIRECLGEGLYVIEFQVSNQVWDFEFASKDDLQRFAHLLRALEHYQKAQYE